MKWKIVNVTSDNCNALPNSNCLTCKYWESSANLEAQDEVPNFKQLLEEHRVRGKIALDDKGISVGFIKYGSIGSFPEYLELRKSFRTAIAPNTWVVTCVSVKSECRNSGIAQALLNEAKNEVCSDNVVFEVIGMEDADFEKISVGPANLYKKAGFEELERLQDEHGMNVLLTYPC